MSSPAGTIVVILFLLVCGGLVARPFLAPRLTGTIRAHWPSFAMGAGVAAVVTVAAISILDPRFVSERGREHRDPAMPPDAMITALQTAAKQNPRDAQPLLLLGRAHFMRGEVGASIAAYTRILEINPEHTQALAELSLVFYDRGLSDVAYKTAQRALAVDPNNLSALWVTGQVLVGRGEDRRAIEVWQRFLRVSPAGPQAAQAQQFIEQAHARLRAP